MLTKKTLSLFLFSLTLLLWIPVNGPAQENDKEPEKKIIDLDWIYKKEELNIKPVKPDMPRSFKWSREGHDLAYLISNATEAPHMVFFDPVKEATSFLITPVALHEAIIELATHPEGVSIAHTSKILKEIDEREDIAKIDRFSWLKEGNKVQITVSGKDYIWDKAENSLTKDDEEKRDLPTGEKENTTWAPNDRYAAYTRDNDLYAYDTEQDREIRLTNDGSEAVLNGKLTWVYWEELHYRRNWKAFYWSPNNQAIAYLQTDQTGVSQFPITDYSNPVPSTKMMYYPKVGTKNPEVRLGVVSLSTRDTQWIDLGEPYEYIARVEWMPDGKRLAIQTLNRAQDELTLLYADPNTGESEIILKEHDDYWVNAHGGPYFMEDKDEFLWLSERSGFRHLYRYSLEGRLIKQLTEGDWEVNPSLWQIKLTQDEDHKRVFFTATEESPLERHIYSVTYNGKLRQLTQEAGSHSANFSADRKYFVDTFSCIDTPKKIQLIDDRGNVIKVFGETKKEDYLPYIIKDSELVEMKNEEDIPFYARMVKPVDFDPSKKYPVIVYVYGGPAAQVARNVFTSAQDMSFVERGFILFAFDTRGTTGRGREWINAIHHNGCDIPLKDLSFAVDYLKSLPYVDENKIGVWGWSNGGYITTCAMTKGAGNFKAGAAVAPLTNHKLYDTIYTERYMGLPNENPEGFKESAPSHYADQLEGELLLAHGVNDDNVHMQNIYYMVDALIEAEKEYTLYIYPQRDHGIGGNQRRYHLFSRILNFFEEHLKEKE